MSSNQQQRIHHKSSPVSMMKQGPMKATIPMISLYKHHHQQSPIITSNLRKSKSNSPTLSPTYGGGGIWKTRSPDQTSGQRSPGSTAYKGKSSGACSSINNSAVIRRTASLDTIYLKGQWPRDCFYMYTSYLQVDKATQTDDQMLTIPSTSGAGSCDTIRKRYNVTESTTSSTATTDENKLKMIRHRLQRNTQTTTGRDRLQLQTPGAIPGDHTVQLPATSSQTTNTPVSTILSPTFKASPVNIPVKPIARPPMRSSIEGLNQEIEGLVLKATGQLPGALFTDRCEDDKFQQVTPEGHRAPLADLLRSTRSVNTQTPAASDLIGSCQSSGGSQGSSPDQEYGKLGTSPHINRFLAREPPDGCEKVNLKLIQEDHTLGITVNMTSGNTVSGEISADGISGNAGDTGSGIDRRGVIDFCPLKPNVTFQLKPSQGSAFYPLQPVYSSVEHNTSLEKADATCSVPLVPSATSCPPADRP